MRTPGGREASRRRALSPHLGRQQRTPRVGPAGCAEFSPAASPGKRGRRARFLLGFLSLGPPPPSSPAAGSVGAAAPGLGRRGGGGGSTTTWPPGAGPRRPGPAGAGREVLTIPPLLHRARPQIPRVGVIRPRAPAATCGRCSRPARPKRPQPVCSFPRIVGFCPVDLFASSSPEANGNHRCSDPRF